MSRRLPQSFLRSILVKVPVWWRSDLLYESGVNVVAEIDPYFLRSKRR
jgi:hypothetical protein